MILVVLLFHLLHTNRAICKANSLHHTFVFVLYTLGLPFVRLMVHAAAQLGLWLSYVGDWGPRFHL